MEFKQNASVITANGQQVGHIDRVVVDPQTKAITHIVVREGFLFTEDKVVPIELIVDTTEDRITLRDDVGDLHALPLFEEKHYVRSEGAPSTPGSAPSLYGYPSAPGTYPAPPDEKYIAHIEQNIPGGTVALREGAKVITAEGKHAGSVERVFTDAEAERATHLLISRGLLSKERKLIPITWVSIMGENEVHLRVEDGILEGLETYPD